MNSKKVMMDVEEQMKKLVRLYHQKPKNKSEETIIGNIENGRGIGRELIKEYLPELSEYKIGQALKIIKDSNKEYEIYREAGIPYAVLIKYEWPEGVTVEPLEREDIMTAHEKAMQLNDQLAIKHAEQARLLEKLNKSLLIEDIMRQHKIIPEWPIKTIFSGYPQRGMDEVFCSFKSRTGNELLKLPITMVPVELYPDKLIEDLNKRG